MKLVVLDYEYGCVHIVSNIPEDIENLEDFVSNELNYRESDICYILLDDDFRTIRYTYDSKKKRKLYDNENFISNG